MEYIQEQIPKCLLMKIHHPPQSAINVTTKKKMNPQAKAFCFIKIRFVPYRLLLRWVTDKKKVWSRSFIWQEALVSPSTNKQYPTPNSLYLDNDI